MRREMQRVSREIIYVRNNCIKIKKKVQLVKKINILNEIKNRSFFVNPLISTYVLFPSNKLRTNWREIVIFRN